jgi:hypothetical protein
MSLAYTTDFVSFSEMPLLPLVTVRKRTEPAGRLRRRRARAARPAATSPKPLVATKSTRRH